MKLLFSIGSIICILFLCSQSAKAQEFYSESWKKGATRIQEKELIVRLDTNNPEYETILRDSSSNARYKLSIWAGKAINNSKIIEWWVELFDLKSKSEINLLKASNDRNQDFITARNIPNWLYPASKEDIKDGVLALERKRVIKIENFYCHLQVINHTFLEDNSGALKSIQIRIKLINGGNSANYA